MSSRIIKKRLFIIVISAAVLVMVLLKIFSDNISLFLKPAEVYEKRYEIRNEIRIGGFVKGLKFNMDADQYSFILTDNLDEAGNEIFVEYSGVLPSLFKEGQMSVVRGNLFECHNNETICFKASEVLAKHDENYKPKT